MPHSRRVDPDYVVDADRGSSQVPSTKRGTLLNHDTYGQRGDLRAGARELDDAVESMPGLTRQRRDRERAMPRPASGDIPHPRMRRVLPAAAEVRRPLSSRQRKARSVTKRAVQDQLTRTQYDALTGTVGQPQQWQRLNDALSDQVGDVQNVDDADRTVIQRVDRAIQAYERASNRGHVLYSNMQLPKWINNSNIDGFVSHNFRRGRQVHFDRFTAGAHNLHQLDVDPADEPRTAVFEIQTSRGIYLGPVRQRRRHRPSTAPGVAAARCRRAPRRLSAPRRQ